MNCTTLKQVLNVLDCEFLLHRKNYSLDCTTGEDEFKSEYFQCAVHLPFDKLTEQLFKSMHKRCSYELVWEVWL